MRHEFVDVIPDALEPDVLYISIAYDVAVHNCFCGCGLEVVTPFSPAQWSITYDGNSVSLTPSIGNWNFPCKSHYWIRKGKVEWALKFSTKQIEAVQAKDKRDRIAMFEKSPDAAESQDSEIRSSPTENYSSIGPKPSGGGRSLLKRFRSMFWR